MTNERLDEIAGGPPARGPNMEECIGMATELKASRAALNRIAGSHFERVGYCQTDIDDVPDMSAGEAMAIARQALSSAMQAQP